MCRTRSGHFDKPQTSSRRPAGPECQIMCGSVHVTEARSKEKLASVRPTEPTTMQYPDVAAFDLDYTVWPCFCDTHLTSPFTPVATPAGEVLTVVDAAGYELTLYPDVPRILADLKLHGVTLLTASRTWAPDVAQQLLRTFRIRVGEDFLSLSEVFDGGAWGDHPKIRHITAGLADVYGPSAPDPRDIRVWLFDDESRNRDVERHGVAYLHVRDPQRGPAWDWYQASLRGRQNK
ncbi:ADL361Cp [Eremothecium gossypii ATCC 10895]|uniref:ADL361Cp n=1 Tax=Eremothecium gossypii (strain ATCC 10895 / CBS 109.51 / FGSC 9923 / NRRL Y-1056) TaxID=284811 RepID=Q75BC8_EREGS|nr:ADL361Cp [Eremothecium gossypii ATCC 10895]AAS51558.2 ADL361Cp [Eremothecium gossypii ATCC 10895]AEY95854.1 FADL361Cp [Eremothecium gossypii FDAG1]